MQLSYRYPRIYSLSTVGIIYHGDCDYVLHPHCTSFAGDSGVGKSIVADLLQLLFVGPGAYESATHSQQPRKRAGLVADTLAYAYANVEIAHGQYVGLGCYLEAAGAAYPFLVSRGYHDEQLTAFEQPLGFRDFHLDGQLKPHKVWAERLRQHPQGIRAQVFSTNYRRYHEVLHKNNILPLDVGSSDSLLKNYGKIIRSFARSGELEKGSIDYLEFLFGRETEAEIWKEYEKLVEELEQDGREQRSHSTMIEEVRQKVSDFRLLLELQNQKQAAQLDFATAQMRYYYHQVAENERKLSKLRYQSKQSHLSYFKLHAEVTRRNSGTARRKQEEYEQAAKQKPALEQKLPQLNKAVEDAKVDERASMNHVSYLEQLERDAIQVAQWLAGPFGPTESDLLRAQRQQERGRVENRELIKFQTYLAEHQVSKLFAASVWASAPLGTDHNTRLRDLQERLTAAHQLQKFNDLDDHESLARWALAQGKPLSREQESMLAYFSSLPKLHQITAAAGARYLADPARLLALPLPQVAGDNPSGFWLDLRGVAEWIPLLKHEHCLFYDTDPLRIERLLSHRAATAGQTAEEIRQQLELEQQVAAVVKNYEDWPAALGLYRRRENLRQAAETAEMALPDEHSLRTMLEQYAKRVQIGEELDAAREKLDITSSYHSEHEQALRTAQESIINFESILQASSPAKLALALKNTDDEQARLQAELAQWLRENQVNAAAYERHVVPAIADFPSATYETLVDQRATYSTERTTTDNSIAAINATLADAQTKLTKAAEAFQKLTGHVFEPDKDDSSPPAPNEDAATKARFEYEKQFDALAKPLGDGARLEYEEPAALIQRAVPEAVKTYLDQPEEALGELLVYLEEVSAKSNQLAEHKLTRLGDLLDRVRTEVKKWKSEVEELESYFRQREAGIAGGFSAKLRISSAPDYPLDWLYHFQDALNAKARGEVAAFDALRQQENLQKLMRSTYIDHGGANKLATAKELLNPKSYLRLTYRMEVEGQVNHGSTGQTFMAAALLNVARLSLIGREGRQQKRRPGIRFMPIDEAAGLGSNYTNLLRLASQQGYQVISLAIEPVIDYDPDTAAEHRIYVLGAGKPKSKMNLLPMMLRGTKAEALDEGTFYSSQTDLFTPPYDTK